MTHASMRPLRLTFVLAAALAGCRAGPGPRPGTPPAPVVQVRSAGEGAIATARPDNVRYPHTAADVHFVSGMIAHHAQAIVMARLAPARGASASVQTLCERIINAQQDEIAVMQQWLKDRGEPVPETRPGPMTMSAGGVEHDMPMPGILTDAQMKELENARNQAFDRLFLTLMIQHHLGAVEMVTRLFGTDGAGQDETVFKMASDINVDQTTEIARMRRMLVLLRIEGRSP